MVNASLTAPPPWSVESGAGTAPPPALGDLLVAPARRWPERTAISDGATSYTFAQLEQGARTVAARLAAQGVGPGDRVVILADKRAVVPILAVAVWKCAAVYVPLDPAEPAGRLRALLTRLEPAAVIALDDRDPVAPVDRWWGPAELAAVLTGPASTHVTVPRPAEEAAYVIFTSGPTGVPQGVENSAAALLAYFGSHNEVLRITPESRVLSLSPFTVDVSFEDTLLPLSLGAFVHQFRNLPAGAVIRAVLARERITHLVAVSMLLALITGDGRQITPAKLPGLEVVMTGAQVCDPAVVNVWRRQLPGARVVHAFGPPEATVFCLTHEFGPEQPERTTPYPVGRPLRGMVAKIVRDGVELRQPGEPGELWVGGGQLMRGYVDQPEETARRVVEVDGVRYFRTGDRCSYDRDGDIVFHGHDDEEIHWLAGRRTHLSELRRAALDCPGVERAVPAVVRRGPREVVALVVTGPGRQVLTELAGHLADLLPGYLRPTLTAWSPPPSTGEVDGRQLIQWLTAAAEQSDAHRFTVGPDGAVEPVDEVETCR